MKHLDIRIHGRVQGVFFRDSAREQAEKLGLNGWARNEPDGSVYIEVEGDETALNQFTVWCQLGSKAAQVSKVTITEAPLQNYSNFTIR